MDDETLELVSRAVDEDLAPDAANRLERRLEKEPDLAEQLHALRRTRDAVSRLAAEMEPPTDLDRTLLALRRSSPPERRPSAWAVAVVAAAVVLGLALAYQLGRRHSVPIASLQALRAAAQTPVPERPRYFELRPLPTSTVPENERPVGVGDRLVTTPDRMPDTGDGEPLLVVGPLPWASPPAGRLTVANDRTVMVAAVPYVAACGPGPLEAEVSIASGLIVEARIRSTALADDDAAACAAALVGATVNGFADGSHRGRLARQPEQAPDP